MSNFFTQLREADVKLVKGHYKRIEPNSTPDWASGQSYSIPDSSVYLERIEFTQETSGNNLCEIVDIEYLDTIATLDANEDH